MPKPRTWKTKAKHLGTMLRHPQQYIRYKMNKSAFMRENHLDMHPHYAIEHAPPHPYPGAPGVNVIYPNDVGTNHAQTRINPGQNLMAANVYDHQAAAGIAPADLGNDRSDLVTLRREGAGENPTFRSAIKRDVHTDAAQPNIGRTQHSTLTGGNAVAAAALRDRVNNDLYLSSGHYQPDETAAVKLAIAGKSQGVFNRRNNDILENTAAAGAAPNWQPMNLTMKRRMQVVSNWARNR